LQEQPAIFSQEKEQPVILLLGISVPGLVWIGRRGDDAALRLGASPPAAAG